MCLAIPAEVIEIEDEMATIQVGDVFRKALPNPSSRSPGGRNYVIVHAGFRIAQSGPQEAQESLRLLRELADLGGTESTHPKNPLPSEGAGVT